MKYQVTVTFIIDSDEDLREIEQAKTDRLSVLLSNVETAKAEHDNAFQEIKTSSPDPDAAVWAYLDGN